MNKPSLDFFELQRYRKRMSLLFYGLFLVVVAIHALVLLLLCAFLTWAMTGAVDLSWWLTSLFGLGLYLVASMAIQRQRIRQGGLSLAKQLGAVRLFVSLASHDNDSDSDNDGDNANQDHLSQRQPIYHKHYIHVQRLSDLPSSYKRYYEFAEQMSLASGVRLPKLYVLPTEMGINAFVAGYDEHDTVLVLTQGAVDYLSNEALYALIGHEFGHILHGDAKFNLKLYVMMAGLSLFYEMAEKIERFAFGDFHANYHRYDINHYQRSILTKDAPIVAKTPSDWVLKNWQSSRSSPYNNTLADEALGALLLIKTPLFAVLIFCYMLGIFGMEGMNWLKSKFNHQRELLADATSMQLTRSFGMVELLKIIGQHDTALYSTKVSAMDYFFFADPRQHAEDERFATHPEVDERLSALNAHDYDYLGTAILHHLDVNALEKSHEAAANHAPIVPLADEVAQVQIDVYQHDYEHFADVVVDGRLVVSDDWFDGFKQKPFLASNSASIWLYPHTQKTADKHDGDDVLFRLSDLPWDLVKILQAPLGALSILEGVLLCRFEKINPEQVFDLKDIYLNLPNHLPSDNQDDNNDTAHQILSHSVDFELLQHVSRLTRWHDGVMIRQLLLVLNKQLSNTHLLSQTHKQQLMAYHRGLGRLFGVDLNAPILPLGKERLKYKPDKLWQACVLWRLCVIIKRGVVCQGLANADDEPNFVALWQARRTACLSSLSLPAFQLANHQAVCDEHWSLMVFLAFLVGVQDNSLLLAQNDKMLTSLTRWAGVLGITWADGVRDDWLLVIEKTHHLSVPDWAALLDVLAMATPSVRLQCLEALHTAFLYDGVVSRQENDILAILSMALT